MERGGPSVVGDQQREPLTGLVAVGDHLSRVSPYLRMSCPKEVPTGSHLVEPLRIVRDDIAQVAEVGGDVGGLGLEPVQPLLELHERSASGESCSRDPDRVDRSAVAGERVAGLGASSRCATASASRSSSSSSPRSSSAASSWARSSSSTWYLRRSISRARARSSPPRAGELGLDLGDRAHSGTQGSQVDAAEPVEGAALLRDTEQGLVAVLPMEVDEAAAFIGKLRNGREAAVAIGRVIVHHAG